MGCFTLNGNDSLLAQVLRLFHGLFWTILGFKRLTVFMQEVTGVLIYIVILLKIKKIGVNCY